MLVTGVIYGVGWSGKVSEEGEEAYNVQVLREGGSTFQAGCVIVCVNLKE